MIKRLLTINGLAILGVVLNHSASWGLIAMFWWPHRYLPVTSPNFDQLGSAPYYALRTIEQLIAPTIPAFLFVSGFFIAFATRRNEPTVSWKVIGPRLWYLLIPYLLWSLVILAGESLQGIAQEPLDLIRRVVTGQATAAYYFVPLLSQLYLLSPLIVWLARRRGALLLGITALLQLAVQYLLYTDTLGITPPSLEPFMALTPSWLFPGHALWFVAGVVVGFNLKSFEQWLKRARWLLLGAFVLLLPLGIWEWETMLRLSGQEWIAPRLTILDSFYAGAAICAFLAFSKLHVPFDRELGELGGKSFGIYLVHMPVLELTARAIYHLLPWVLAYQILFLPVLIIAGLAVPLLLMAATRFRLSPARGYYQYIFG